MCWGLVLSLPLAHITLVGSLSTENQVPPALASGLPSLPQVPGIQLASSWWEEHCCCEVLNSASP